jgi:aryl-alcohol dehydrogenase-like predicted oxidoreductase
MRIMGPPMGLGMAALGRPGYINLNRGKVFGEGARSVEAMQEASNAVMAKAMELGITWFDCARSYGLSEKFVGDYLRRNKVDPNSVFVSSKWG